MLPALIIALLAQDPEGSLRNDTFLKSAEAAQAVLLEGDQGWLRALAREGDRNQLRTLAFEAWRRALVDSVTGDTVRLSDTGLEGGSPFQDDDGTHHRRIEGVAPGVLRRLLALDQVDRQAWRDRFEPLAQAELALAPYRPRHLEGIERTWPLTRAAGVAALRCSDLSLEQGSLTAARTWLGRAEHHAQGHPSLEGAVSARRQAIARLTPPPPGGAWQTASDLSQVHAVRLESKSLLGRDPRPAPLGRTLEPGAAPLAGGGLAVQTPRGLMWLDGPTIRGERSTYVGRLSLAEYLDLPRLQPFVSPSAGGWPLIPAGDGHDLVLVVDRGHPGRVVREHRLPARGNHLVCLAPGEPGQALLRWHLSDQGLKGASGQAIPALEATGIPGHLEFQPGPVLHEGTVYVQARVLTDPTAEGAARGGTLYLLALDQDTGLARWSRMLTLAADLRRDLGGRNGASSDVPTSGMPLALHRGVLTVGTNVGLVLAFDAVDGRCLWGIRTRRRTPSDPGWPGSRRPLAAELSSGSAVLVAPFDSDHLYALPTGPALGSAFFVRPPEPQGAMLDLVGGSGGELLFLGRDGRHSALRRVGAAGDVRSALFLGREERFVGAALTSKERVIVASDGAVYLFDRSRGDLLLAALDLEDLGAGRGGTVTALGDRIFVVGRDTLWVLAAK